MLMEENVVWINMLRNKLFKSQLPVLSNYRIVIIKYILKLSSLINYTFYINYQFYINYNSHYKHY